MPTNIRKRLEHLEAHHRGGDRPLKALLHRNPQELTKRELTAIILGGEPWEVKRDLTERELRGFLGEAI